MPTTDFDHYRALEVPVRASQDEIRNAYRRLKESVIGPAELASESIDAAEAALHRRIEAAYDVLSDPDRRAAYDRSVGIAEPDKEAPAAVVAAVAADEVTEVGEDDVRTESIAERPVAASPAGEAIEIGDDVEIDGPLLKKVREARGMDLKQVAAITKIGADHLAHIEEERFEQLPAMVYVRGFLSAYARVLRLDVKRASTNYLKRYQSYLSASRR